MPYKEVTGISTASEDVQFDVSVIITIKNPPRSYPVPQLYQDYKGSVEATGLRYEFIFVVTSEHPDMLEVLYGLNEANEHIKIIQLGRWFGQATALSIGFEHARGALLLSLPAHPQVDPEALPALFEALPGNDMVIVRRGPRVDSRLNRLQTRAFHFMLKKLLGTPFQDLGCNIRLLKREVAERVQLYGDQHRFFPIMASRVGFKVKEVALPQSTNDNYQKRYPFGVYIRRLLDVLSIFFLVKFTKKPLRFFGLTGLFTFVLGTLLSLFLAYQRLFMGIPLADRPVLLLGLLLIVLGIQLFAIGLIGEMIIFTHAKDNKEYTIEKIIN